MAFNLIPIIKFIAQNRGIAETVNTLIKQFKNKTDNNSINNLQEIKNTLEVQAALNEQLEKQINILNASLENVKTLIKYLKILVFISLLMSSAAIIIAIAGI